MKLTSEQQEQLRTALVTAFRNRPFDATSIVLEADDNPALAAALVAIIPECEGRSRFRAAVIRDAVWELDLDTDAGGYWLNSYPAGDRLSG